MPAADVDAGQARGHQRERDPELVALAEEVAGIVELERERDAGRDRAEREVALVPVEADAEPLAALPEAAAHDAGIGHRGGIRARLRTGEPEAGNLLALGEARQPVVLLRLGAEVQQQLAGAERVRHRCGDPGWERTRREL